MSSASGSPLHKSTETLNNESHTAPKLEGAAKSENAMSTVTKLVSDFLASRIDSTHSGRSDVVFEGLSVEGSGRGVRSSTMLLASITNTNEELKGPSRIYRPNRRQVCTWPAEPAKLPKEATALSAVAERLLRHYRSWRDAACHWEARERLHHLPQSSLKHAWGIQGDVG